MVPAVSSGSFVSISVYGSSVVFFVYHEILNELCSVNCSLLLFIFQNFEFCNHLFLTTLFVTEVLDGGWL